MDDAPQFYPLSQFKDIDTRPIDVNGEEQEVIKFSEKPQIHEGIVNGGFFVFNKGFFNYLDTNEDCILEKDPLETLRRNGELMLYRHTGFWHCMDTYRDSLLLNEIWESNKPEWKVWK